LTRGIEACTRIGPRGKEIDMAEQLRLRHFVYGKFTVTLPGGGRPDHDYLAVSSKAGADLAEFAVVQAAVKGVADLLPPRRAHTTRLVLPTDRGWVYCRLFPTAQGDAWGRGSLRFHAVILAAEEMTALACRPWRLDAWLAQDIGAAEIEFPIAIEARVVAGQERVEVPIAIDPSALPAVLPLSPEQRQHVALAEQWLNAGYSVFERDVTAGAAGLTAEAFAARCEAGSSPVSLALDLPPPLDERAHSAEDEKTMLQLSAFEARTGVRLASFLPGVPRFPQHWADVNLLDQAPAAPPSRPAARTPVITLSKAEAPAAPSHEQPAVPAGSAAPSRAPAPTGLSFGWGLTALLLLVAVAGNVVQYTTAGTRDKSHADHVAQLGTAYAQEINKLRQELSTSQADLKSREAANAQWQDAATRIAGNPVTSAAELANAWQGVTKLVGPNATFAAVRQKMTDDGSVLAKQMADLDRWAETANAITGEKGPLDAAMLKARWKAFAKPFAADATLTTVQQKLGKMQADADAANKALAQWSATAKAIAGEDVDAGTLETQWRAFVKPLKGNTLRETKGTVQNLADAFKPLAGMPVTLKEGSYGRWITYEFSGDDNTSLGWVMIDPMDKKGLALFAAFRKNIKGISEGLRP
jgi:hypothetical protein